MACTVYCKCDLQQDIMLFDVSWSDVNVAVQLS